MTRTHFDATHPLILRIRSEFREMPGLSLTASQASRLWSLDPETTSMALEMLVSSGMLARTDDGRFVAQGDGPRIWNETPAFG